MRRWLFFVLAFAMIGLGSASVAVNNYSVDGAYSPFEMISGEIDLTIVGEDYEEKIISNDDDEIALGDFLFASGVLFDCSPWDCSRNYEFSNGPGAKDFMVSNLEEKYVGFVLYGEDVILSEIEFGIDSDFSESSRSPLGIDFFEKWNWEFDEFSDSLLSKDWGCYNQFKGVPGSLIGDSRYCEMISILDTGSLKIGVNVGSGDGELDMRVYPDGSGSSWSCSFDPDSDEGCFVYPDSGEIFYAGDYQVCVSSPSLSNYKIYEEDEGSNCGFVYDSGSADSVKDYAIFAQNVKYADASSLGFNDFDGEDIVELANNLIEERYSRDCSGGCVLPLAFSGISQNVNIYDVSLVYTSNFEWMSSDSVYDLDMSSATVDFDGIVDLTALNFTVSESMDYIVSLEDVEFFNVNVTVLPAPIILSLIPSNPPAGVPIRFYVGVDFNESDSLSYEWEFGDNKTSSTTVPFVTHTYSSLDNYTLSVEVSAGGDLKSTKKFVVSTISPEVAVDVNLVFKKDVIVDIISVISGFPSWYADKLSKIINVDFFDSELDRLSRESNNSFSEQDFIDVAKDLYALDIPAKISISSSTMPYLMTDAGNVNVEPVEIISGAAGSNGDVYTNSILNWQSENIYADVLSKKFVLSSWSGIDTGIFSVYSFDIDSKSREESYLVINKPFSELYFKESVGERKAGSSTVVILPAEEGSSFEFYYEGTEPISFFASPKLSSLVVDVSIDSTCNYNFVCEEDLGENSDVCRNDCKPVGRAVLYVILSLLFMLVIYTALQVWYKHRYEKYLFKDARELYNLLMYVTNAQVRGMEDLRIAADLRKKGWSSERVNYVIKKSRGEAIGLYEIIPVEKVFAYFRNRRAKRAVAAGAGGNVVVGKKSVVEKKKWYEFAFVGKFFAYFKKLKFGKGNENKIVTKGEQQIGRKINKSEFRRRV